MLKSDLHALFEKIRVSRAHIEKESTYCEKCRDAVRIMKRVERILQSAEMQAKGE